MKILSTKNVKGEKMIEVEVMEPRVIEYSVESVLRKIKKYGDRKAELEAELESVNKFLSSFESIKDQINVKDR